MDAGFGSAREGADATGGKDRQAHNRARLSRIAWTTRAVPLSVPPMDIAAPTAQFTAALEDTVARRRSTLETHHRRSPLLSGVKARRAAEVGVVGAALPVPVGRPAPQRSLTRRSSCATSSPYARRSSSERKRARPVPLPRLTQPSGRRERCVRVAPRRGRFGAVQ
jgi:hypothetical protein